MHTKNNSQLIKVYKYRNIWKTYKFYLKLNYFEIE